MLNDQYTELLTAYVDGELTNRQRKAVLRLLRRSSDARKLLRDLQEDAERVRRLPRQHLAHDFSARVLHTIAQRKLRPGRLRPSRPLPLQVPAWIAVTVAASVLLMVTATSYIYFARPNGESLANVPHHNPPPDPDKDGKSGAGAVANNTPSGKDDNKPREQPKPDDHPKPPEAVAVKPKEKPEEKPDNPKPGPTPDPGPAPLASAPTSPDPNMEMFKPKQPDVPLPVIFKLAELDQAKLKEELKKDSGFRLELPCKEGAKAFERLQAVLKARGVGLLIDKAAQDRLGKPQLRTNFVLYAEDLTPDDLVKILQQLADEERQRAAKKAGDTQFEGLVVSRMGKGDREELSKLLGVDPARLHSTGARGPLGVDPSKPVSEGTADKVVDALKGSKPGAKPMEHQALVLAYNPVRPHPGSAEVQKFLDGRKPSRTGTVQVLLVLRETRG
jgi:hypothetical protein